MNEVRIIDTNFIIKTTSRTFHQQIASSIASISESGDSTKMWPKKSYDIELTSHYAYKYSERRPIMTNKFSLKAAYIDPTYVRNLAAADLWRQCLNIFIDDVFQYTSLPNSIAGHLVQLYVDDEYKGIYEFCTHPDSDIWYNDVHDRIFIEDHSDLNNLNKSIVSVFCNKLSKSNKKAIESYNEDINNNEYTAWLILYLVFIEYLFAVDNYVNNIQIIHTQNKIQFFPFDLESTFGLHWRGEKLYPYDKSLIEFKHKSALWESVHPAYIAVFYNRLKNVLCTSNVLKTFDKFNLKIDDSDIYSYPMKRDLGLSQIEDFCKQRDEFMQTNYLNKYHNFIQ